MGFKKGEIPQGAKPFQKGQSGNPNGTPGPKRSTVAKKILEMEWLVPEDIFAELKKLYPTLSKKMTVEDIIYIRQAHTAIKDNNTQAAKFIMDSRYGAPKQEIEHSGEIEMQFDLGGLSDEDLNQILAITAKAKANANPE